MSSNVLKAVRLLPPICVFNPTIAQRADEPNNLQVYPSPTILASFFDFLSHAPKTSGKYKCTFISNFFSADPHACLCPTTH